MKSTHTNKKSDSHVRQCQECGKDYTQVEFVYGVNLCDHLALDALALKMKREQRQVSATNSIIDEAHKREARHCPRCQGLLVNDLFFDWECNGIFVTWRCVVCGNILDDVIADNRMPVDKHVGLSPSRHLAHLAVALPISVQPMFGSREAPVEKSCRGVST